MWKSEEDEDFSIGKLTKHWSFDWVYLNFCICLNYNIILLQKTREACHTQKMGLRQNDSKHASECLEMSQILYSRYIDNVYDDYTC